MSVLCFAEGDLALQGSIGSLSLSDLTSHGEFYRERFTTSGEEALIFQIFKYEFKHFVTQYLFLLH